MQTTTYSGKSDRGLLTVRRFRDEDAAFCFRVRSSAFIVKFYDELGSRAVAAGVNAYMPSDFVRLAAQQEFFVVEREGQAVGFFTLRREGRTSAEIPLIYLDLKHVGGGIGSWSIRYIEGWINENWPEVSLIFLDTVIPKYNGGFYRKVGFEAVGEAICRFPDTDVPAIRFEKSLAQASE